MAEMVFWCPEYSRLTSPVSTDHNRAVLSEEPARGSENGNANYTDFVKDYDPAFQR